MSTKVVEGRRTIFEFDVFDSVALLIMVLNVKLYDDILNVLKDKVL